MPIIQLSVTETRSLTLDAMITLPFIYHFEDYHEGPHYAVFLSAALGVDVGCKELAFDEQRRKYPFEFDLQENLERN